ncbi:MAG: tRNA 2-thiouridine(34) synthase MnmA [Acidimicrobiales bacterium]|nr:tRNA 2-thiouridine(34) synthase MnmA [Acidimicrobiales bacterium]
MASAAGSGTVAVMMSGGVDSAVAAALLLEQGYAVVGVTMKLWGGESDSGCCSVSDVDDARRVADQLGIDHHVFNFGDTFDEFVVDPYVAAHGQGLTPNPCIECNRHVKFDRMLARADALGFDAIATGHHARVATMPGGGLRLARGADAAKDQSYVLYMLDQSVLRRLLLPVGEMTKDEVRSHASRLGLRIASKPDSQDVCFITAAGGGRPAFLTERMPLTPGTVVDRSGATVGSVDAVQLVTIGQRKGLNTAGQGEPVYAIDVDVPEARVTVGRKADLLTDVTSIGRLEWADQAPVAGRYGVQISAHGRVAEAEVEPGPDDTLELRWVAPHNKVAAGQSVVLYEAETVIGGGIALP